MRLPLFPRLISIGARTDGISGKVRRQDVRRVASTASRFARCVFHLLYKIAPYRAHLLTIWGRRAVFPMRLKQKHDRFTLGFIPLLSSVVLLISVQAQAPGQAQIAFHSNRDGAYGIYVMDADGQNLRRLTHGSGDYCPAWSTDGGRIAFGRWVRSSDIYVMGADGKNIHRLTDHPAYDSSPEWSPDGQSIAFHSRREGPFDIYAMDADGKNIRNLTDNPARDSDPAWSPDGQSIAFSSDRDGQNTNIYVMNVDGKNIRRLTELHGAYPTWSPDGQRIAFCAALWEEANSDIYVMDADGKNIRRLTDHPAYDRSPAWSPDGQGIAFVSFRDGNYEVYVMDANGENQHRLTNHPGFDMEPAWSGQASAQPVSPAGRLSGTWGWLKRVSKQDQEEPFSH